MKKFEKYSNWIMALLFIIVVIAVYKTFDNIYKIMGALGTVIKILSPFVTGFVIAYILNMPCKRIDALLKKSKYKFLKEKSKTISILCVYLIAALSVFFVIRAVVPAIYKNMIDLYYNVPVYIDEVVTFLSDWQREHNFAILDLNKPDLTKTLEHFLDKIDVNEFSKYAQGVVSATSGIINIFIGIIVSVYMLAGKEKIFTSVKRVMIIFLKKERSEKIIRDVSRVNEIFSKYVFCLLMDALIIGVLSTIVLSALQVKYAIILGLMIGICNLIPYFGAIIASVSSVIITLITGGIFKALWTAVSLLILQQIDGNFIGPRIMGQMLNASPLWIIFAVTLGGGLFGIAGMIISVPVLVVIKMIITDYIDDREKRTDSE